MDTAARQAARSRGQRTLAHLTATPCGSRQFNTTFFIESAATGAFGNERAWLRFDLSSIPAGATITSTKLNMWCWKATGASLPAGVYGGDSDAWGETTVTYNNQPTFGAALDTQTLASGTTNLYYLWDATAFTQTKFTGNKLVSLLVKPVTENSADSTSPAYGFDSKEFTANHPFLQVSTPSTGAATTVSQVQFFYRYSADNLSNWTAWTAFQTSNTAPYSASFSYPNGEGVYEFYSVATDSAGNVEPAPAFADTSVTYAPLASNIAATGATLNGALNPNGASTTVHFEYGTDTNYGQSTNSTDLGAGTSSVPFSLNLSGLQPNTTYHYRLVSVTNGVTTDYGDQSFTSAAPVPAMPRWAFVGLAFSLLSMVSLVLVRRRGAVMRLGNRGDLHVRSRIREERSATPPCHRAARPAPADMAALAHDARARCLDSDLDSPLCWPSSICSARSPSVSAFFRLTCTRPRPWLMSSCIGWERRAR